MLRSVKEPLHKILGKALLSYQELATVLTKLEAVINSRPLTSVSDDVRDQTPITPAHLSLSRSLFSLPDIAEKVQRRYKVQRRSDTCIRRSVLTISGSAGEESTCISYQSDISGCVNSHCPQDQRQC